MTHTPPTGIIVSPSLHIPAGFHPRILTVPPGPTFNNETAIQKGQCPNVHPDPTLVAVHVLLREAFYECNGK